MSREEALLSLMRIRNIALFAVIASSLILLACSSAPTGPRAGTPEFYWQAARETYSQGDYAKADEHLSRVIRSDNEYTNRAMAFQMVLTSGMLRGLQEFAATYEDGAKANRLNPTVFRRQALTARSAANPLALQFAEVFQKFVQTAKDPNVTLDFPFPKGSAAEVPELAKVSKGLVLQESEVELLQKRVIARAVLLNTCRATGNKDDAAKTAELFKAGSAQVPRATFILAMATALFEESDLFSTKKLDQPQRMKLMCNQALEALKTIPETKETKALAAKIQATLKKAKL